MNKIEYEMKLLLELAASGKLPGFRTSEKDSSYFADNMNMELDVYCSGENDVMEQQMRALWESNEAMRDFIPILLAAVEKSRGKERSTVVSEELFNYTM